MKNIIILLLLSQSFLAHASNSCDLNNKEYFKFLEGNDIQVILFELSNHPCKDSKLKISIYDKTERTLIYHYSTELYQIAKLEITLAPLNEVEKSHDFINSYISELIKGTPLPPFGNTMECGIKYIVSKNYYETLKTRSDIKYFYIPTHYEGGITIAFIPELNQVITISENGC